MANSLEYSIERPDTLSEMGFKESLIKVLKPATILFILLTILTGIIYPFLVTVTGKWLMPDQASGSLIEEQGKIMGSRLIGQNFTEAKYFWGRPSATGPYPYNAMASSGSNFGPLNPVLAEAVKARVAALKIADSDNHLPVPVDLVTTSASGLDPEISPAAASYQVNRVAKARGLTNETVQELVDDNTLERQWNILGEPRVNVLLLNIALDKIGKNGQ